jgi:hypothetical protein
MHLQECRGEEKERNTNARLLALSHRAGPDGSWHGKAYDVCVNGLLKSGPNPHRSAVPFVIYFCYELVYNKF